MYSLYMLIDPTGAPDAYIGTSIKPYSRYTDHLHEARFVPYTRKSKWILSLADKGLVPTLVILESGISKAEIIQAEVDAIRMCRAIRGDFCLNMRAK